MNRLMIPFVMASESFDDTAADRPAYFTLFWKKPGELVKIQGLSDSQNRMYGKCVD